jgi:hypothetical protein
MRPFKSGSSMTPSERCVQKSCPLLLPICIESLDTVAHQSFVAMQNLTGMGRPWAKCSHGCFSAVAVFDQCGDHAKDECVESCFYH